MKTTAAILAGFSLALIAGCSANAVDESTSTEQDLVAPAPIAAGSFELFAKPAYAPQSMCEPVTKLTVQGMNAHLEDHFAGPCPTFAVHDPNPRDYALTRTSSSCGSNIYTAELTKNGVSYALKLTDHRTRLCRDIVPARIIVEETLDGKATTLFSNDAPPPATTDTVYEGELMSVMAIGGETTGTVIRTEEGPIELILDAAERAQFVDGKRARVKGKQTSLFGVETGVRPAVDVSDILVCPNPGWVNCMPGPGEVRPYCTAENRTWIRSNCDGVDFAD